MDQVRDKEAFSIEISDNYDDNLICLFNENHIFGITFI